MTTQITSREEVVDTLMQVFRDHGYDGTSLSILSEATGLGRSSLYHYFPNGKADMGAAVLARAGEFVREHVVGPLKAAGAPRERVERFALGLDRFYMGGSNACLTNVFAIGEAADLFGDKLQERLRLLIATLANVAQEDGQSPADAARHAEDVVIAFQGALVVSHALRTTDTFRRILSELPDRLLRQAAD
ncbi:MULTISPECIES: TetR/AcrR family transcriptional regulator [Silvimonas]|uniref:TetR/AcrR family transcriptional regulator n=1 Tax=Silvimonas TaxID=300264 RepID=UPI0024B3466B|nr:MULTISPECIES: TetR/AcrR family transcriptional regulator [Silvimonas]MDR3426512.1 TetR/AcrR family transcriptional regulator [Silvimonas sp.]